MVQSLYYPPEVGGLESHVAGLCTGLARRGHDVHLVTSRSRPGLARNEVVDGVDLHRLWMPGRSPLAWAAHVAATLPSYARLARGSHLVHAHTFACGVPPLLAGRRYRRPLVLTLHTSHFLRRARSPLWRPVLRQIIRGADYLLATSQEILDVAMGMHVHPRAEVMTNAVDTDGFSPAEGGHRDPALRLIVPRRLYPKNGVEYFVRAMPLICRELDVRAIVVGDGPERARLTALAAELGVAERIEFLGARSNQEMPSLMRQARMAVIPSLMEATSIAALEAMACGLPVAASAVGGLPEIINEDVGALFRPADPEALAREVCGLLRRPDLSRLGKEGRRRVVANWSLNRMVDRHIEIYSELIDEA